MLFDVDEGVHTARSSVTMSASTLYNEPLTPSPSIDKSLASLLAIIHAPPPSNFSHHEDPETGLRARDMPTSAETLARASSALATLQKKNLSASEENKRRKIAEICLQEKDGYFEQFAELEDMYFRHAPFQRELRQLVPDSQIESLNAKVKGSLWPTCSFLASSSRLIFSVENLSYSQLARQSLRTFFADNMTIIIGNLFIVTLASFFLGTGVMLLIHEGGFFTSTTIHHSTFSFGLADCLFRLNAVHQAFIPYLRNGEGSPRVWKFFTAFIMSAVMALVALGLLFKSMALYAIFNFLGAWGLMVGVWILLENERQM
jgi:hypothetical protein